MVHASSWAIVSWGVWVAVFSVPVWAQSEGFIGRYIALCSTGCVGVAVLGARRPGVMAWNFVVAGLLVVLLLPLAEGISHLSPPRLFFLGATLAVAILNYVPTRFWPAALVLAIGVGTELATFAIPRDRLQSLEQILPLSRCLLAVSPWVALAASWRATLPRSEFDRHWLGFRDRYGLFWAQRIREQFNRSATNAGWPVQLNWQGLYRLQPSARQELALEDQQAMVETLRALLKRFGPAQSLGDRA